MIDWKSSSITEQAVKNKDYVSVVCSKCDLRRDIKYSTAKKYIDHLCASCVKKKGEHITGDMVIYKCKCGVESLQQYRYDTWNENWLCHHCAMVQGHKDGKFVVYRGGVSEEGKERISEQASERWKDPEYRKKWKESRDKTKDARSVKSKELWSCPKRLAKLSESLRKVWEDSDYRYLKSKQSQEFWQDDEYKQKQLNGYNDENRKIISEAGKKFWSENRELMISIIADNLSDPEVRLKLSVASKEAWKNIDYRILQEEKNKRVFADEEIIKKCSDASKEAWKDPEFREYHCEFMRLLWQDPVYKEKMAIVRASQSGNISSIQRLLYDLLDAVGAGYEVEGEATRLGYYVFDCLVRNQNGKDILIECQGDYWHSQDKAIRNDKSKFTYVDRYFPQYEIMYIWEHEFYTKDRVLDRLKLKLGIDVKTVDFEFKDVTIKPVEASDLRSFLDAYHYIGKGRGGSSFGAYFNDELIACCVFSPPLRQNTAAFFGESNSTICELSRFCIHPSYHKKNFASWLVSKCIKQINVNKVIAYSDSTVGHVGTIYKASNFVLDHVVPADFWYADENGYVMHKRTLYGKASKMKMTELEYAEKYGYMRVWGGTKTCFVFNKVVK